MSMGIKVAELNTLSDAKGITGIRFFKGLGLFGLFMLDISSLKYLHDM